MSNIPSNAQIAENKREIITLLSSTHREGMDNIISYLERADFFNGPSSENKHHNWKGGLAQHCLGVYHKAKELNPYLPEDSLIIAAILHDICKASVFTVGSNGWIHKRKVHIKGHGYRSIWILKHHGLRLTEDERRAIRWHMSGNPHRKEDMKDAFAAKASPLWKAVHQADHYDASINKCVSPRISMQAR